MLHKLAASEDCGQDRPPSFALLFAGQGCQRLGMLGWAEEHERAWPLIQKANEVLSCAMVSFCLEVVLGGKVSDVGSEGYDFNTMEVYFL